MNASVNSTRAGLLITLALLALGAAACSHDIGDGCQTSVDCDPSGTRSCDLSQPGGYCTIINCDETTCPSGATCVRYFPVKQLELTTNPPAVMCDPNCEDLDCAPDGGAPDGGTGRQDKCTPDEVCLSGDDPMGHICAKRSYEQRECAKVCSSNADCRSGYDCRDTGELGSMPLSSNPAATTKFCAPHVAPAPPSS
jgi:hypothetical protein